MGVALKPDPTFVLDVAIPQPAKPPLEIKVTYKHKTKTEFAAFLAADETPDEVAIMDIAERWDVVGYSFDAQGIKEFCENFHAAGRCIVQKYMTELTQLKKGN